MLNNILGHVPHSSVGEIMYWTWANNHPNLHTAIEILQNTPLVIALYIGLKIVETIFRRR